MGYISILIAIMCSTSISLSNYDAMKELNTIIESTELESKHITAYYGGTITASGTPVRKGICAGKREWIGDYIIVYENVNGEAGDLIGIYECLDTGFGADSDGDGIGSIQEGKVIDVWCESYEECKEFMRLTNGKCFIRRIEGDYEQQIIRK